MREIIQTEENIEQGGGLRCSKCQQPMRWHSDQEVDIRKDGRQITMQVAVFECGHCHRLAANSL